MLTIGKLAATRGQLEYYEAQVAAGAEDYYAGRGESPGRWQGRGAELLGLPAVGQVERAGFMRLMHGRHPVTDEVLREMGARSTVAALDLTLSAPKSVSVLFAVADAATAEALLAAHEQAITAAIGYLEREACWTRRGRDGAVRVRGDGFIGAAYRHRMSRAGDPQLHTHIVIGNLTRADGRYTALEGRALYQHRVTGGAVYRAVLRAEVAERLPWVSWRRTGRGLFEIDGVPDTVLRHFSQRRVEIEERALELAGGVSGPISAERMQKIALETRRAKRYGVDGSTWRQQARARAAEHGLGQAELAELRGRLAATPLPLTESGVFERLSGPDGLTRCHNTFARRHALAEIAAEHPQGAPTDVLEAATDRYLADGSVIPLQPVGAERRYTTTDLLACEQTIITGFRRRRREGAAQLPAGAVAVTAEASPRALTREQAAAAAAVMSSGQGIDAITAVAGSGKTTTIVAVAACYRQAGWSVIGAAPTARAARQLRETAAIEAGTMHSLLRRLQTNAGFPPRTVLVLDEAGMAPTRLTAQLFEFAERAGTKIIAVGDPGQLASVEAGGWLAPLTRHGDGLRLSRALRQRDPSERDALQALHDGDVVAYVNHKLPAIRVHESDSTAVEAVIDEWLGARARYGCSAAVMITRDNVTREWLNRAARAALKANGELSGPGLRIDEREFTPGDRVVTRRNDRRLDIDNGTIGTVTAVDAAAGGSISLKTDTGEERVIDARYAAAYLEHAYALTAHAAQGATVDWAAVIGQPRDFTREWAYTALSRARSDTVIHLTRETTKDGDRDDYAPVTLNAAVDAAEALARTLRRTETEPLAVACSAPSGTPTPAQSSELSPPEASSQPPDALPRRAQGQADPVDPAAHSSAVTRLKGLSRLRRLTARSPGPALRP